MALIECPECHKEISDQADSCPHCGYRQFKPSQDETPTPVYVTNFNKKADSLGFGEKIGCVTLLILLLIIGTVVINCHGEQAEKEYEKNARTEQMVSEWRGYHDYSSLKDEAG